MRFRLADGAGSLLRLLRRCQRHVVGITLEIAVGGVILFTFLGGVHGLGADAEGGHQKEDDGEEEDFFHGNDLFRNIVPFNR